MTRIEKLDFSLLISYFSWENRHRKKHPLFSLRKWGYCFQKSYHVLYFSAMILFFEEMGLLFSKELSCFILFRHDIIL